MMIEADRASKIIFPVCWSATNNGKERSTMAKGPGNLKEQPV
jgi:hypothetical protein